MRYFAGASLLSLLVVAVIIAVGQSKEDQVLLGSPSSNVAPGYDQVSPIGRANNSVSAQTFQPLFTEIEADIAGGTSATARSLTGALRGDEPEDHVGAPLAQGGIKVVSHEQGQIILLCQEPRAAAYTCQAERILTRTRGGEVAAATLAQAEGQAQQAINHLSTNSPASGSPEGLIQRAKQLAGSGQ